ncbi:MAG: protein-glutamate O-methyltransferase CheR [Spirochaetales bacterium]|nr:protein-glutamate O-methyltransferase CheR [Spirochaetales bacterium]
MEHFLTESEFELFRTLIYNESGIHFSDINRSILESRLKERIKASKLSSAKEYHSTIIKNQEELKILLDSVTTNLTRFFRNAGHFSAFENFVLKDLAARKEKQRDKCLRIWSAGCATGEEPFSIAMVLKELLPSGFRVEIIGSDLSLRSLMIAKTGFYPSNKVQEIPGRYLDKYFEKKHDGFQIKNEIMELIRFDYHNLKFDSGLSNMDIVFCRNVIIYFDADAQKASIERIWNAMNDYSYLFIGHSESLFGMNTRFEFVKTQWATFYKKNTVGPE